MNPEELSEEARVNRPGVKLNSFIGMVMVAWGIVYSVGWVFPQKLLAGIMTLMYGIFVIFSAFHARSKWESGYSMKEWEIENKK